MCPGGGHGNPLQCSCLENPMGRGAWWTTVHAVVKSQTQLNSWAHMHACTLYSLFFTLKHPLLNSP